MAGERLTWVIELVDQMSGPAGRMTKALSAIESSLKKQSDYTKDLLKRYKNVSNVLGGVAQFAGLMADAMVGLGISIAGASAAFAYFGIKASIFGENTRLSLEAILGSKAVASVAQSAFQKLTTETSFGIERITKYGAAYLQLGDTLDSAIVKIKILGALQVAKGGGEEGAAAVDRLQGVILRFMTGDLPPSRNQLKMMLADAGSTVEELERQIVIYSKGRVTLEQVKADLLKNQIPSDVLVTPLIAALQHSVEGGTKVGVTAANAANNSLGGLGQRLRDNLFLDFDFSKLPGFDALKSVLRNLVTLTQPGGSFQKNMQDFATSFSQFLDPLKGPEGLARIKKFFDALTGIVKDLLPILGTAAHYVEILTLYAAGERAPGAPKSLDEEIQQIKAYLGIGGGAHVTLPTTYLRGGGVLPGAGTDRPGVVPPLPTAIPLRAPDDRRGAITLPPITLHIHTAATNKDEAKKISDAVQDTLPTALQRAFENLATQGGY